MPTLRTTPFGSSYVADPFDQSEQFGAQLNQRQRELAQSRLDTLGQLGMQNNWHNAQIGEQGREFDVGQRNQYGLASAMLQARRDELGLERDRFGKQFDYQAGRDQMADKRWQQEFQAGSAGRAASDAQAGAQTQLLLQELDQMKQQMARQEAAKKIGAPADLATAPAEVQARFQQDLATSDPATASANYATAMTSRGKDEAEAAAERFGMDAGAYSKRDNKAFGWDPTQQDKEALRKEFRDLTDQLVASGLSRSAAVTKARSIFSANTQHSANSGWTDDLARELGVVF